MRTRRVQRADGRVVIPVDIHDIRVLTSTGPIDLPMSPVTRSPAARPERSEV